MHSTDFPIVSGEVDRDRLSGLQEEHAKLSQDAQSVGNMGLSESGTLRCLSAITDRLEALDKELQQWDRNIELKVDYLTLTLAIDQLIDTVKNYEFEIDPMTMAVLREKFINANFEVCE